MSPCCCRIIKHAVTCATVLLGLRMLLNFVSDLKPAIQPIDMNRMLETIAGCFSSFFLLQVQCYMTDRQRERVMIIIIM